MPWYGAEGLAIINFYKRKGTEREKGLEYYQPISCLIGSSCPSCLAFQKPHGISILWKMKTKKLMGLYIGNCQSERSIILHNVMIIIL